MVEAYERVVPGESPEGLIAEHVARYRFAAGYTAGRRVLDVACGTGYGSALLRDEGHAREVAGVDVSDEALACAWRRWSRPGVYWLRMDATRLAFPASSFDVVCSFETIEHLRDWPAYLREVARVLRPGGTFLVSTPNRRASAGKNPFHVREFTLEEFREALSRHFTVAAILGQRFGAPPWIDRAFHALLSADRWQLRRRLLGRSVRDRVVITVEGDVEVCPIPSRSWRLPIYMVAVCRREPDE
jgi:ubiquinone/menaquinone biosynthesis C-methylase UbiE